MAETHDLDQNACRAILPEVFEAHAGAAIVFVDIGDVGRRAHDVVEGRSGIRKPFADALAHLAKLRRHVAFADDFTGRLARHLPCEINVSVIRAVHRDDGHVQQIAVLHPLPHVVGTQKLAFDHVISPFRRWS
jgi:hypothetical protein